MAQRTLSLRNALAMHKQAGAEATRKDKLLKAAAAYAVARNKDDVDLTKKASVALAEAITLETLAKKAGLASLAGRAIMGAGRAATGVGRKFTSGGRIAKGLSNLGAKAQGAGAKITGGSARGAAKAIGKSVARGAKAVGKAAKGAPKKALVSGKKALGRGGRKSVGAAGRTAKHYAPVAGAAGVGAAVGAGMTGGKEKKEAGLLAILTKKATTAPTLLKLLTSKVAS